MATQQNTFIRKFGDKAIIITVTDWDDFKELEAFSNEENPDFLVKSTTTKSIYSNMMPSILVENYRPLDITKGTRGMGLAGIITDGIRECGVPELDAMAGTIWGHRKCGLTYSEEISKVEIK